MKRGNWRVRFKGAKTKDNSSALSNTDYLPHTYIDSDHFNFCVLTMEGDNETGIGPDDVMCSTDKKTETLAYHVDPLHDIIEEIDQHLQEVKNEVHEATNEEKKRADDERAMSVARIEEEAEREIRAINRRRDEKLRKTNVEFDEKCGCIGERNSALLRQLQALDDEIRLCVDTLKTQGRGSSASANLDQLISGVDNTLKLAVSVTDAAEQVSDVARGVAFVRMNGNQIGKIDGYEDRWVLQKKLKMALVHVPVLKGSISPNEVVIEDIKTSSIYVANIETDTTRIVIEENTPLFNCASQIGGIIVCGTKQGRAALYDQDWKYMKSLTAPGMTQHVHGVMCVAIDNDGTILVAPYGGNYIHVYQPSNSRWMKTIEIDNMVPIHGIHVLNSGIVVHSAMFGERVCLIDNEGSTKITTFLEESEDKCLSVLAVGHRSDALFNLSCDSTRGCCVVEELHDLMCGQISVEKLVEFPAPRIANGLIDSMGLCILGPSKIVTCDGGQLLVYVKKKGVSSLSGVAL